MKRLVPILVILGISAYSLELRAAEFEFLVPKSGPNLEFQQALDSLAREFNELHPSHPVKLRKQGRRFSSIQPLMASSLAARLPSLALVEPHEIDGLREAGVIQRFGPRFNKARRSKWSVPLLRSAPVLIVNQEVLFRNYSDPARLPTNWKELNLFLQKLENFGSSLNGVSFRGADGLWFFESLLGRPLWEKTPGGSRVNRELKSFIEKIRNSNLDGFEASPLKLQKEFQSQKTAWLVAPLHELPRIARTLPFRWKAVPFPSIHRSLHLSGSDIVVTRGVDLSSKKNGVSLWIDFLTKPKNTARWTANSGLLPRHPHWRKQVEWKQAKKIHPEYARLIKAIQKKIGRKDPVRGIGSPHKKGRDRWLIVLPKLLSRENRGDQKWSEAWNAALLELEAPATQ